MSAPHRCADCNALRLVFHREGAFPMIRIVTTASALSLIVLLTGCHYDPGAGPTTAADTDREAPVDAVRIDPGNWPLQAPVMVRDEATEQRIADLLSRMTLEEKVGQVIQADISAVTPEQVRQYNLGSVLNGGNSAPGGDNYANPEQWLALADAFWDASTDTGDGGVGIPAIWGTDAVHGHSNIVGATLFPHNIGLGMANDPELMADIGRVTALEIRVTGLDWTFAPTIAVVRNDRWGRTYESYSEDPRIVAAYAPKIVEGIQGVYGSHEFLDAEHLIATAKHFAGDGGTDDGRDQGNTTVTEAEFRDVQAAAYPPAIRAGVQSVMASYNSFHGRKMHGYGEMLTGVLRGRMGFDGFVIGDWNGHAQVAGCSNTSCVQAFNAGLDMYMAPDGWQGLYQNLLGQVKSGEISAARLDEAVSRILRVKIRAGVFEAGRPSSRRHAGDYALLGSAPHRAIARKAVRESLVLLKNEHGLLPLAPSLNVLVAGDGAQDIGKQSGGWTLTWQGTGNRRENFPNATSIFEGLSEAFAAGGGSATLSEDGSYSTPPDVAIVVFGEDPYAEGVGDRPNVDFDSDAGLELLKRFREAGIPTVSVFLSGRPMWVNPELDASDAFVAAWLPGSEGAGIADVLVGNADGTPRNDFHGRLSFSWPRSPDQAGVNVGDADYDPLFPYGYGLSYGNKTAHDKFHVRRCANIGNALEARHEGQGGHTIRAEYFEVIAAAGFDTVRLPVRWNGYTGPGPDYIIDPAFFARVDEVIGMALANDLQVILNLHHFDEIFDEPDAALPRFLAIWEQVGAHYADLPDTVYLEPLNEPHAALSGQKMRDVLLAVHDVVRKTNPDRVLIYGGDQWSKIYTIDTLPDFDDPDVVLTFHYYEPFAFTHQFARWVGPNMPDQVRGWGDAADREELQKYVADASAIMQKTGALLFMGEFGAYEKAPYADRLAWLAATRTAFEDAGIPWCVWSFTATFPIWDHETSQWNPGQLEALGLRPPE
jgi:beta-glucosidase